MGEPTRVHERRCGARPVRGPGRESRRRRDVPSVRQFRHHRSVPWLSFTGTVKLDFSNDFSELHSTNSIKISVQGRPVLFTNISLSVSPRSGLSWRIQQHWRYARVVVCDAPVGHVGWLQPGQISFGEVVFGDLTEGLLGATGVGYARPRRPRDTRPSAAVLVPPHPNRPAAFTPRPFPSSRPGR